MSEIFNTERAQAAEIDRLRVMPIGQFRFEKTWLKVESKLLPSLEYGEIYIVSDNETKREIREKNPGAVIYVSGEIKRILDLDPGPETMKLIHAGKAILGGRVVETKPKEF